MFKRCCLLMLMLFVGIQWAFAQDGFSDSGTITDRHPEVDYDLPMSAGDTVTIAVTATSGDLDTTVTLYDPDGEQVAFNDDIDTSGGNYDSQLVYTAETDGTYAIVVGAYGGTGDFDITASFVETDSFDGEIQDTSDSVNFDIDLTQDETVAVSVVATSGDLDTVLTLLNPEGGQVTTNDDVDPSNGNYNSQVVYQADEDGTYTIVVSAYTGTGEFTVTVAYGVDLAPMSSGGRPSLEGEELTRETDHFIIHYTDEGDNAATDRFIDQAADDVELVWDSEVNQMGWPAPPTDNGVGGDDRYDVYITALCDEEGGDTAYGYTQPEGVLGDNPSTDYVEDSASASFLVVDNNFNDSCFSGGAGDLLTTLAHEFHHAIQFGYDANEPMNWYFESTSTWMETQVAGDDEAATIYVADYFQYPEVCFGSPDTMYGNYLFIQSLVDAHGADIVQHLWQHIAEVDGMQALEDTLAEYDDTVEEAIARYGEQNLVRDYPRTDRFNATEWLENTIDDTGTWTFTGEGIQELGTNYFLVDLRDGRYNAELNGRDARHMGLWAIAIKGDTAEVFQLGNGGTFSTEGYDQVYLMIVNFNYDDDPGDCSYDTRYEIRVSASDGELPEVEQTWDASHFEPLDDNNN